MIDVDRSTALPARRHLRPQASGTSSSRRSRSARTGSSRSHSSRGFTLLEVLIALAILATAMTILMGTMANNGQRILFSDEITVASQLARSKMVDIEYQMMREGFDNSERELRGDFRDEGRADIRWEATITPVEIPPEQQEALMAQINAQLFGGVDTEGALKGNAAFSSMLPMLVSQMPAFINRIGTKVRRVDLIVTFNFAGRDHSLELSQYVVDQENVDFNLFGDSGLDQRLNP